MSKSLKNFITIESALQTYSADGFRMFYLMHQYDRPLDWAEETLNVAMDEVKRFETFFQNVKTRSRDLETALKSPQNWGSLEKDLHTTYQVYPVPTGCGGILCVASHPNQTPLS